MEQPMIAPPVVPDDDNLSPALLALVRAKNEAVRPPRTLVPRQRARFRSFLSVEDAALATLARYRVAQGDEPEAA